MKSIIENFINLGNGLNIIDAPTGYGKTYSINDFILDYNDGKNIFFITNQIKNLNYDSLKKMFEENNKLEFFLNNVLLLDATYKNVMKINDVQIVQQDILDSKEYYELSKICFNINKVDQELKDYLEDNIRNDLEPKFRKFLKKHLENNNIFNQNDLNSDYDWIKILYPIIHLKERKIFIMTTKKFVMPQDSLLGHSFYFYNSDLIKDSIIFIDEFDSAKRDILSAIISQGVNYNVDIFALFNRIHFFLANNKLPTDLLTPGSYYQNENNIDYLPETRIKKHLEFSKKLIEECFLDYSFKLNKSNDTRNFIFRDDRMISVNNTGTQIKYELSKNKNTNIIFLDSKRELPILDTTVYRTKNNLEICIDILTRVAENYFNRYNSEVSNKYKITFDESINTVLNQINAGLEYKGFLYNSMIKRHNFGKKYVSNQELIDKNSRYDFYLDGINIFELSDDVEYNEKTIIKNYAIEDTPERILYKLATDACVIGVSATGTIETNINNFDLNKMKELLKDKYRILNEKQLSKIRDEYRRKNEEYDDKGIEIEPFVILNTDQLITEYSFLNIINDIPYKAKILDIFEEIDNEYYRNLLAKIVVIIYKFLIDEKINSFVCFLNFNITKKSKINREQIIKIFEESKNYFNNMNSGICFLRSFNYEYDYELMKEELKFGKKVMCLTTYATMSSGQNIQYEIPDNYFDYVVLDGYSSNYKDFDGIYLHYPTYLTGQVDQDSSIEEVISHLFDLEYLKQSGAFKDYADFMKHIRLAFGKRSYGLKNLKNNINIKNATLIKFIQSIGRICRTNNKNKKILIIADEDVVLHLHQSKKILNDRVLNKEILSLIEKQITYSNKVDYSELKKNRDCYNSFHYKYIKSWNWTLEKMNEWKAIRKYLLANPTLDKLPDNELFTNHYIKLEYPNDNLVIDFKTNYIINISSGDAFLDKMLECDGFEDYCKRNNIKTIWDKKEYIIGNHSFSGIYKAALGEEFVKFILNKKCNINLSELESKEFELFDFKYNGIYFDFKNWNHRFEKNESEAIKSIYSKMNRTKAKKIFVINAIKQGNYKQLETIDGKIEIIDYIYDPKTNQINNEAIMKILKCI